MTREEAICELQKLYVYMSQWTGAYKDAKRRNDAITMAINALKMVRPVECIDEAVGEAIRVLNAINSSGRMDYENYCEIHDAICAIGKK